jgi:hypothetical protein
LQTFLSAFRNGAFRANKRYISSKTDYNIGTESRITAFTSAICFSYFLYILSNSGLKEDTNEVIETRKKFFKEIIYLLKPL